MMNRHFDLRSELIGAIAKILQHALNQLLCLAVYSINSFADIYIYIYLSLYIYIYIYIYIYTSML